MKEKHVQNHILDWLRMQSRVPLFVWRQNAGGVFREYKGRRSYYKFQDVDSVSDIIGVMGGSGLAIEVKAGYNKPTIEQRKFLKDFARAGGIATCAWDLDDVISVVDLYIKQPQTIHAYKYPIFMKRNKDHRERADIVAKISTGSV